VQLLLLVSSLRWLLCSSVLLGCCDELDTSNIVEIHMVLEQQDGLTDEDAWGDIGAD
jgi:hypothetical protein